MYNWQVSTNKSFILWFICNPIQKFCCIISYMKSTQFYVNITRDRVLNRMAKIYPELAQFNPPEIVLSNRLTVCAGYNIQEQNLIHLGNKFFAKNSLEMFAVILPHEIIHQIDYNLFGTSELKCGHGYTWQQLMIQYGLPANVYHEMEL